MMCNCAMLKQDKKYHDFADKRNLLFPNTFDVASNFPMLIIGTIGVFSSSELWLQIFFIGCILTFFGSSYYHLHPNNATLFWDRLPMTISFMSIFTGIVYKQCDLKDVIGEYQLLMSLLVIGISSVVIWRLFDNILLYGIVQYIPMLITPFLLFIRENPNSSKYMYALLFYVIAKILELTDKQVYKLTGKYISGHTLKHLAASVAMAIML